MTEGITLAAIAKIVAIDVVLSGDNAVVIAMASRALPSHLQRKAIFWGGAGAIGLRVVITALVAYLLRVPFLQLLGGVFLLWVAFKLLVGEDEEKDVKAGASLREAVVTIIVADFVMSLDNMLAVGGASHGSVVLLLSGLLISMGVIMFSSSLIAKLMNRYGWLVYAGAGILAWTATEMIIEDQWLDRFYTLGHTVELVVAAAVTGSILTVGYWVSSRAAGRQQAAAAAEGAEHTENAN
jgi:YjbE family integral membrane protein